MQDIGFFEQYEWEAERQEMVFWARVEDRPLTCRVSAEALVMLAGESDETETPAARFIDNLEAIQAIAARMIRDGRFDAQGEVIIDRTAVEPAD